MGLYGSMKVKDLAESQVKDAVIKDGSIMCPKCNKRLAIVTEYGMIRNCKVCGEQEKDNYWNYGAMG